MVHRVGAGSVEAAARHDPCTMCSGRRGAVGASASTLEARGKRRGAPPWNKCGCSRRRRQSTGAALPQACSTHRLFRFALLPPHTRRLRRQAQETAYTLRARKLGQERRRVARDSGPHGAHAVRRLGLVAPDHGTGSRDVQFKRSMTIWAGRSTRQAWQSLLKRTARRSGPRRTLRRARRRGRVLLRRCDDGGAAWAQQLGADSSAGAASTTLSGAAVSELKGLIAAASSASRMRIECITHKHKHKTQSIIERTSSRYVQITLTSAIPI